MKGVLCESPRNHSAVERSLHVHMGNQTTGNGGGYFLNSLNSGYGLSGSCPEVIARAVFWARGSRLQYTESISSDVTSMGEKVTGWMAAVS